VASETTKYQNPLNRYRVNRFRSLEPSKREKDVLHLMARCVPPEEIADLLDISPKTVEKHMDNISLKVQRRVIQTMNDLKGFPQWICHTPSKIPINPHTGKGADCNDPASWSTYDHARLVAHQSSGRLAGTGFEFIREELVSLEEKYGGG
jgi:DNA-binding CsgD family transcriptional regulator